MLETRKPSSSLQIFKLSDMEIRILEQRSEVVLYIFISFFFACG